MNKIFLIGNTTKDIEVIENDKVKLGKFTIAVSRPYKNVDGGYDSDFLNCIVFNASDYIKNNLTKGTKIAVEGSVQTRTYEVEGQKKYSTDIIVNKIEILTKKDNMDKVSSRTIVQENIKYDSSDLPW